MIEKTHEKTNDIPVASPRTLERLHELGFESEREFHLYLQLKKALRQKVPIGIAS